MKMRKYLAALMAMTLMCGAFTACGGDTTSESDSKAEEITTEAPTTEAAEEETAAVAEEVTAAPAVEMETPVGAESGQAYLSMADAQWWIQYNGKTDDAGYMLAYNAGVVDITGDGQYTVSVTADTNGFRYDTTGDPNGEYTPSGCAFSAVIIKDGESLFPNAIITIDSIVIDGEEVEMVAKNYTNSEDGHIRSNIFNSYVNSPSGDARSVDGFLYNDYDTSSPALADADAYSAQIVDQSVYNSWTTIEVNFTVSGLDDAGEGQPAAEGEGPAVEGEVPAEGEAAADDAAAVEGEPAAE